MIRYLIFAGAVVACDRFQERRSSEAHLEISWDGKDRGNLAGPATARWCGLRRVLEIQAIAGDTGVALALYPKTSIAPGTFPVLEPAKAESLPPSAGVAVRWLGQTLVQGFRGDSGTVTLERSSSGAWSGRVAARARSVVDTQRIRLTGSFRDLTVRPDSQGCAPADRESQDPEAQDTSVH
jgi:hypothetical protein